MLPGKPGYKVGLSGLEPLASALSAQRSNHLSYRPLTVFKQPATVVCLADLNNSKVTVKSFFILLPQHRLRRSDFMLFEITFLNSDLCHERLLVEHWIRFGTSKKGGDPGAPSGTPTLLRLRPSYQTRLRQLPPYG